MEAPSTLLNQHAQNQTAMTNDDNLSETSDIEETKSARENKRQSSEDRGLLKNRSKTVANPKKL